MDEKRNLVLSDTHRLRAAWYCALRQSGPVDEIFHLGDNVGDAAAIADRAKVRVTCVKGNCDFGGAEAEELVQILGHKILLTHGHNYGVKYSIDRLCYAAEEKQAEAAFFGHTHRPLVDYYHGILLFNPGSLGEPRGGRGTFGMVLVSKEGIFPKVVELQG